MSEICSADDLTLQIIATGMHLSPEFGLTYKEIEADGFNIDEKIEMLLSSDSPVSISKAMALGLCSFSESLVRLCPDIVVILGDRFESMAMACACMNARIPIAHLHGGESTQGGVDEAFRHCITKMSHLHFASCDAYRSRIIQLGENPECVFNVGAIGVENIKREKLLLKNELEHEIKFDLGDRFFLVTYHPVTLEKSTGKEQFENLLVAIDQVSDGLSGKTCIVFTKANADAGGRIINQLIDQYVREKPERSIAFSSMGQKRYLSALKLAAAVVGNSSSGIIEAPSFKTPVVNIGDRQKGRVRGKNVIDCSPTVISVVEALNTAISQEFYASLTGMSNPYEKNGTVGNIKALLKSHPLEGILKKTFFDIAIPE